MRKRATIGFELVVVLNVEAKKSLVFVETFYYLVYSGPYRIVQVLSMNIQFLWKAPRFFMEGVSMPPLIYFPTNVA